MFVSSDGFCDDSDDSNDDDDDDDSGPFLKERTFVLPLFVLAAEVNGLKNMLGNMLCMSSVFAKLFM